MSTLDAIKRPIEPLAKGEVSYEFLTPKQKVMTFSVKMSAADLIDETLGGEVFIEENIDGKWKHVCSFTWEGGRVFDDDGNEIQRENPSVTMDTTGRKRQFGTRSRVRVVTKKDMAARIVVDFD